MVDGKISIIREYIAHPWKAGVLAQDKVKWKMLLASMDVIEDAQLAIESFLQLDSFRAEKGGYLYLYGLLQALYLQQDALRTLYKVLLDKEIDYEKEYPDLYSIRELRNNAVGHPTDRGLNWSKKKSANNEKLSFHFIVRSSITKEFFTIVSYFTKAIDKPEDKEIQIKSLLEQQERETLDILTKVINVLDKELGEHKMKFKDSELSPFKRRINDGMEQISKSLRGDNPVVQNSFDTIKDVTEKIKSGLDERYGSDNDYCDLLIDIQYISNKLESWFHKNQLIENQDARIFYYALKCKFNELVEDLKRIDNEFSS